MFPPSQYELLDFGSGRRLERFGPWILDRPAPVAEGLVQAAPELWTKAAARYQRGEQQRGAWAPERALPEDWTVSPGPFSLRLKPTAYGHLGVFPEQAENWDWIARQVRAADRPLKVLNLFAYTGASTLAAAAAGAEVVHVDAARNTVGWARHNAEISALADAPIRWIVEDAVKFVEREVRRKNRYDAVILDPPSYGHGPQGQPWIIGEQLQSLLRNCGALVKDRCAFFLLTCHTPAIGAAELRALLANTVFGRQGTPLTVAPLCIESLQGQTLPCGLAARWPE